MRLQRHLNELFKTDVPVKVSLQASDEYVVDFKIGDIKYEFSAVGDDTGGWEIIFLSNTREDITGTGNAAQVFAGVIKAFKMFMKSYRPHKFYFYAKERSRVKLYDRLVKSLSKDSSYNFEKSKDSDGHRYEFKKPKRKMKGIKTQKKTKKWGAFKSGLKPL